MPASHVSTPTHTVHAIVVEDQPSTLLLMHAMLERAGYHVVGCPTGQLALDALASNQYDLLVLDLNLPDMSGLDLLRSPRLTKLPAVLGITGSLTPAEAAEAESAGMIRVLQKPISCEQLIETAAAAIRAARSTPSPAGNGPVIDPTILSEVRAISDERLFHRFVNQALADAWHCLEELDHTPAADPARWRQHVQTLNGVVRSLGARRLASAISEALALPSIQLLDVAPALTRQFVDLLDEAQEALRESLPLAASDDAIGHVAARENTPPPAALELSERERQVLRWTAAGKTSSETGTILGISARTVNFHVTSILLKLNAVNKTQAVVKAVMLDLLN
jgi:DNA-binding NarL/FixJ family response regulator